MGGGRRSFRVQHERELLRCFKAYKVLSGLLEVKIKLPHDSEFMTFQFDIQ